MATKLRAQVATNETSSSLNKGGKSDKTFEEVFIRNDVVSLCLLLNRRARTMRVIDFRAGASNAKKLFVQSIARRERIKKVFVLVERDECATWGRLGFVREGSITGFYKRSDAFIMGCVVPTIAPASLTTDPPAVKARTPESGVFSVGRHMVLQQMDDADGVAEEPEKAPAPNSLAERTVVHARKIARDIASFPRLPVKISPASPADIAKRIALATKEDRALTGFESFGRDVCRDDIIVTAKASGKSAAQELLIGAEIQRCYGNAFVEVLTAPRDDRERAFLIAALSATCERLLANEIVCAFALTPAHNVRMATAFAANGFRRTGLLREHVRIKGDRNDAILWSRKLANPDGEE
ncbi:MAG: hypothetical protein NVSMB1_09980 [Polyangiales bacterium]